jgi:hypothetical protein
VDPEGDDYAETEAACVAALSGEPALIPWRGRRAAAAMLAVEKLMSLGEFVSTHAIRSARRT